MEIVNGIIKLPLNVITILLECISNYVIKLSLFLSTTDTRFLEICLTALARKWLRNDAPWTLN